MQQIVKVGTRSSLMARQQAGEVQADLAKQYPEICFHIMEISTRGDRDRKRDLAEFKRPGIFTSGLERALSEGEIDLAVHSYKDLPTVLHPDLVICAVTARLDPADVLVSRTGLGIESLGKGARIGTCSPRRQRLLASLKQDYRMEPVRGNVDTRIRQMDENSTCDALIVAACGLERLGLMDRASHRFEVSQYLTAPAQGALAIQCRAFDEELKELVAVLDHKPTRICADAERKLLVNLGGGCALAVAAFSQILEGKIELQGALLSANGKSRIHSKAWNADPEKTATVVADDMIGKGCLSWL